MLVLFRKLLRALPPPQRRKLPWFALPIACAGLLQLAAVASVAPFMAALSRPDEIGTNALLSRLHDLLGMESPRSFVIALGAGVFVLIVASNAMSAWTNWMVLRFAYMQEHHVTKRLLESYLYRPYVYFVQRNTAELSKVLFIEVRRVIIGLLVPGMLLIAKLVTACFILALLVFVEPLLASIVVGGSALAYVGVYARLRRRLRDVGEGSVHNATARTRIVADALGGVKELKVLGREAEFVRYYSRPSKTLAAGEALSHTSVDVPRYALEAIAFGSLLGVLLYLVAVSDEISQALPLATVYGFAGYRLFPAIQELFVATTKMRYHAAALDVVVGELAADAPGDAVASGADALPLALDTRLRLVDASFTYPDADRTSLTGVSVEIAKGELVAVVGPTGSGKTSFLDILAGLVHPSGGLFCVDDTPVDRHNVRRWQKIIGYVPQNVFLADDTVKRNIAFGENDSEVDMTRLREAARVAQIDSFVCNELADGYDTLVGERGVKLSGGQRQRIAIARALYRDPAVLLLDEATSALDPDTESAILSALRHSCRGKTIVLVSHRPAGLAQCDKLLVFEHGRLVDQGPVGPLMDRSAYVRRLLSVHGRQSPVG